MPWNFKKTARDLCDTCTRVQTAVSTDGKELRQCMAFQRTINGLTAECNRYQKASMDMSGAWRMMFHPETQEFTRFKREDDDLDWHSRDFEFLAEERKQRKAAEKRAKAGFKPAAAAAPKPAPAASRAAGAAGGGQTDGAEQEDAFVEGEGPGEG